MKPRSLYGPVQEDLALVAQTLEGIKKVDFPALSEMLNLVLSGQGKQLRPALVLLAGRFSRYDLDLLVPVAASIELLHTATLVHDDVIDGASTRRGRSTANAAYRNTTAVMLGDYMFAHAADLVAVAGNVRVVRLFARTLRVMVRGEIGQDMTAYDSRQNVRDYLNRIAGKTASLFAAACEGGAVISGHPESWIKTLHDYGHHLGMAFQVVDDILDFTGDAESMGKSVGSDLMQGTLTLPSLLLLEKHPDNNPIKRLFAERDKVEVARAVEMVRQSEIPEECYRIARGFADRAREALDIMPDSSAKQTLLGIVDNTLERQS